MFRIRSTRALACACTVAACAALPRAALAQHDSTADTTRTIELRGITVIGTSADQAGVRARIRDVPGSVAFVDAPQLRATRQANLGDVLRMTPGVFVQPRFGAADESQISIRGSGLRGNFHLRGLSVLVNGMPYRNADGFSDFESLELLTAENVQVWKGGNALRYGGSTLGGAVNIETRTGYTARPFAAYANTGSYGFLKAQAASGASRGAFDYYVSYARTSLDGYRDWADQGRDRVNLHAGWVLSPRLDLRFFGLYANVSEHLPGSLTRAEMDANPRAANANNKANKWGRDYQLYHAGFQLRSQLSDHGTVEVAPYFQYRDIDHPIFEVLAQDSRDAGIEARYENTATLAGHRNRFTLGAQYARGNTTNRQYANNGGAHGALTKDQLDRAGTEAVFVENVHAHGHTPLSFVIGMRYERSHRGTTDHFTSNGDQSDHRSYGALLPKAGLLYDLAGGRTQLFANVSRSFEPPLLLELNSLAVPGFIQLAPQSAWRPKSAPADGAGRSSGTSRCTTRR